MRALVVGLGRMGRLHRKVLLDLGYDVVSADPFQADADYTSVAEAMMAVRDNAFRGDEPISVAAVAVPIDKLMDVAFQLAGVPKLLVEKPFAPTLKEALLLGAYLKERRSDVAVGYVERFNPVIRQLPLRLQSSRNIMDVRFVRHNARPSGDHELDLLTHDVDLASHLGFWSVSPTFDVKSDNEVHIRRIEVDVLRSRDPDQYETVVADLMDHTQSPLHAMWHAFLTDGERVARPRDAARTLERARAIMSVLETVP